MANKQQIEIPRLLWMRLVSDLRSRGCDRRESGAFLLSGKDSSGRSISRYICYDDLDPHALEYGLVEFHRAGFSKLWDICKADNLQVLADVHTHPTSSVMQSSIDKANPMLPVRGHVALIMPKFGDTSAWSLAPIGIYRFAGGGKWESFQHTDTQCPAKLTLW